MKRVKQEILKIFTLWNANPESKKVSYVNWGGSGQVDSSWLCKDNQ